MRKRFFAILALIVALAFPVAPAGAELIFTRQDNSYANTALGIVLGDGAPIHPLVSNMGGNQGQGIYPFVNADGNFRVAITLYTLNGTDVINIHNPGPKENWKVPQTWNRPQEAGTSLHNTRILVTSGGYLYGTAYDIPTINRVSTRGDRYTEDKTYLYTPSSSGNKAHGEGLVAYGDALYAIFTEGHDVWNIAGGGYAPNRLVKLDKDLNVLANKPMLGKNLDGFTPGAYIRQGNLLYVATLGGVQPFGNTYNPDSCVEIVNLDTMDVSAPVTARRMKEKDPTFSHMFGAVASAWGKIYVQATQWVSEEEYKPGYSIRVYETTAERLAAGDLGTLLRDFKGKYGYRMGLVYDPERNYLWAGVGYSLWRYDGTNWREFDANALGGNISAYTAISLPTGPVNPPSPSPNPGPSPSPTPSPSPSPTPQPGRPESGVAPSLPGGSPEGIQAVKPEYFAASGQTEGLKAATEALSRTGLTRDDLRADSDSGVVKLAPRVAREVAKKVLPASETATTVKLLPVLTARLSKAGDVAAAGVALTVTDPRGKKGADVKLLKVTGPEKGVLLTWAARPADFADGRFTVLDDKGNIVEDLKPYVPYVLTLFIRDGGPLDLDGVADGKVVDPAAILTVEASGTPAPNPEPKPDQPDKGKGGGGGCDAGLLWGWLLVAAVPVALRRK